MLNCTTCVTGAEKVPVSAKKEGLLLKSNQLLNYNVIKERKFKFSLFYFVNYINWYYYCSSYRNQILPSFAKTLPLIIYKLKTLNHEKDHSFTYCALYCSFFCFLCQGHYCRTGSQWQSQVW